MLRGLAAAALAGGLPAASPARAAAEFGMAYFETYSPLSFVDHGTLRGVLVDTLEAVLVGRLGIPTRHEGFPWPRAQRLVEAGERDAICTIATPERLAYAEAVTEPVVSVPTCIFVRADNPRADEFARARDLAELQAMKPSVVSYSANGWAKARLKDFDITGGGDFNSAIKMLIARRADVMIENVLVMSYILARTPGGDAIRLLRNRMDQADFQLLISRKSAFLERRIDIGRALQQYKATPAYAAVFQAYGVPLLG